MDELLDSQTKRECHNYEDYDWLGNVTSSFHKMLEEGVLTDIKLCSGEQEYPCHRLILATSSPYFRALLTGPMRETSIDRVEIPNTPPSTVALLLEFIYTGKVKITEDNVQDLVVAANYLIMTKLVAVGSDFLRRLLELENCLSMHAFAEGQGLAELTRAVHRFIMKNFLQVTSQSTFLEVTLEHLKSLSAEDNLQIPSEVDLFHQILLWISHEPLTRTAHLPELLVLVRLPYLSDDHLETISRHPLVAASKDCLALLEKARLCKEDVIPYPQGWRTPRRSTNQSLCLVTVGGRRSYPGRGAGIGSSQDTFFCDPEHRPFKWGNLASLSYLLRDTVMYAVTGFRNFIYLTGGFEGDVGAVGHVWRFQMKDGIDAWARQPPLNVARYQHGAGVGKGHLYVVGGQDSKKHYLKDVECIAPEWERWKPCPSMPKAVAFPAVVGYREKLFVIGGMKNDTSVYPWIQCYDSTTREWSIIKTLEIKTKGMDAVLLNDTIYILGGSTKEVIAYDPENDSSFAVSPLQEIHSCGGIAVNNGKIYVAGGDNLTSRSEYNQVECFDPSTNVWCLVGQLPLPLHWHKMVSFLRDAQDQYMPPKTDYPNGPSVMFRGFQEKLDDTLRS